MVKKPYDISLLISVYESVYEERILGKRLEVYLTNEEARKLEELCELNGNSQSRIVKDAISMLHTNGHSSGEHNGQELRVEIPLQMRLKGVVRQAIKEMWEEDKLARKQKELADEQERIRLLKVAFE